VFCTLLILVRISLLLGMKGSWVTLAQ